MRGREGELDPDTGEREIRTQPDVHDDKLLFFYLFNFFTHFKL